jgi:hypothetical protein
MKVLASHKFKNDKEICIGHLSRRDSKRFGLPDNDSMAMCFIEGEDYQRAIGIDVDEALIIIQLLSEAIRKSVKRYEIEL